MSIQLSRFKTLDLKIKKSLAEAGDALREIRDKELYRQGGFKSFKEYCESIGRTYNWGWKQIEAGKVASEKPEVKTVAEALGARKLAMPKRRQIAASESEEAEEEIIPPKSKKPVARIPERKKAVKLPKDGTGIDIPPEIQDLWNRNEEVENFASQIKRVRIALERAYESNDVLWRKMDRQGTISRLIMAEQEIRSAEMFAVCHQCNGIFNDSSCECKGRGAWSEYWWKVVPEDIRRLRPIFKIYK